MIRTSAFALAALAAALVAVGPVGADAPLGARALGGPPWGWAGRLDAPAAGTWRVELRSGAEVLACERFEVRRGRGARRPLRPM